MVRIQVNLQLLIMRALVRVFVSEHRPSILGHSVRLWSWLVFQRSDIE